MIQALLLFGNSDDLSSKQRRGVLRFLLEEMELPMFNVQSFFSEEEGQDALSFDYEETAKEWVCTMLTYAQSLNLACSVTYDVERAKNPTWARRFEGQS